MNPSPTLPHFKKLSFAQAKAYRSSKLPLELASPKGCLTDRYPSARSGTAVSAVMDSSQQRAR